jgi:hypothetical protein
MWRVPEMGRRPLGSGACGYNSKWHKLHTIKNAGFWAFSTYVKFQKRSKRAILADVYQQDMHV